MCPAWLLVAVVMVGGVRAAVSECWDHPSCQSSASIMECIQVCRSDLSAETPVIPGPAHLQLTEPAPSLIDPASSEPDSAPVIPDSAHPSKRSYSMEHFRWGKPVGRKRRPIKVYTSNDVEAESAEVFPGEIKRAAANQLLPLDLDEANQEVLLLENKALEEEAQNGVRGELLGGLQQKKNAGGGYKMKHFRWSGPPESKRYGGFMKSWDERGQRPLLTLFKNVINKDQQQV